MPKPLFSVTLVPGNGPKQLQNLIRWILVDFISKHLYFKTQSFSFVRLIVDREYGNNRRVDGSENSSPRVSPQGSVVIVVVKV